MTSQAGVTEEPHAEVQQDGRWTYRVVVIDGMLAWGPDGYGWLVLGRKRAEAKARRVLRRYLIRENRRRNVQVIGTDRSH